MGKYTTSLIKALGVKNNQSKKYSSLTIILNKNLNCSDQRLEAIKSLTSVEDLKILDLPVDISTDYYDKNDKASDILTEYIASQDHGNNEIDYLITAPFFVGFCSVFPRLSGIRKFSIVYDITPQKIENIQKVFPDDIYYGHYRLFFEADHLFTISKSVKDDLERFVGISQSKMTNIDGAPFMSLSSTMTKGGFSSTLKYPYIHLPSGSMVHKNNERAIKAFEIFSSTQETKYKLYVTSTFDEATRVKLSLISKDVIFTGNITDEDMHIVYSNASAVLFPSLAEGLGMPVLEASIYDTPVACSNIPVLSELSSDGFYLFDPNDTESMASALSDAVRKSEWQSHYDAIQVLKKRYTWARSAEILEDGMSQQRFHARNSDRIVLSLNVYTDAAYELMTLIYGELSTSLKKDVEVGETGSSHGKPIAYYATRDDIGSKGKHTLIIKDASKFIDKLLRKEKHSLLLDGNRICTFTVRQTVKDTVLKISGWEYIDIVTRQPVTVKGFVDIIDSQLSVKHS